LTDIRIPVFALGTESDHVAPWHSVYKFNLLLDTPVTFLLASGGHNTGIVSEPGRPGHHYRVSTRLETDPYVDPETWRCTTTEVTGSWWSKWTQWLSDRSGEMMTASKPGVAQSGPASLAPAPGTYVLQG
jgi:polyhydroxyalkanoate synthase subunit PhaC